MIKYISCNYIALLKKYDKLNNVQVIKKGEPIFMRLNIEEEIEYIKNTMKV